MFDTHFPACKPDWQAHFPAAHSFYANDVCIVMRVPGAGEARLERTAAARVLGVPAHVLQSEVGASIVLFLCILGCTNHD